jgi:hemimethylated DNA binding protein
MDCSYRAVIFGWDAACARGPEWAAAVGASTHAQAFYAALPDERDCERVFGGPRMSKYVAEENVEPIEDTDAEGGGGGGARITHRALPTQFHGYAPAAGRYVPIEPLRFRYPADAAAPASAAAAAEALEPAAWHADVLALPDAEEAEAATAGGGRMGGGRRRR